MKKKYIYLLFLSSFIFLTLILFRDFLYSYRMQLENFLPYYNYQNQILYYSTGDKTFDIQAPMNLRFLGLIVQYLIFKIIPCIELTNIKVIHDQSYVCATFSNALMNYISMTVFLSLIFIYSNKKLNYNLAISVFSVLLAYIFFHYLEAFTLDRISVLYLLIVLYYLDNKKICIFLIILSALVNEKIVMVMTIYFFIKLILNSEKFYFAYFISSILSLFLVIGIFLIYSFYLNHGYWGQDNPTGIYNTFFSEGLVRLKNIFANPKGISNALLPIIFAISPYLYLIFKKDKKRSYEILVPLSLILLGMGGGTTNIGRYVMYSMPLWIPLLSSILFKNIKEFKKK